MEPGRGQTAFVSPLGPLSLTSASPLQLSITPALTVASPAPYSIPQVGPRSPTLTSWGVSSSSGCPPPSHPPCPRGSPVPVESWGRGWGQGSRSPYMATLSLASPPPARLPSSPGPCQLCLWVTSSLPVSFSGFLGICPISLPL